ncbi:MAG: cation:proton antiporter [Nanoarchaeota archaeon]|nr:cation:proton antiporter [Nanoarchaeota archaeon]
MKISCKKWVRDGLYLGTILLLSALPILAEANGSGEEAAGGEGHNFALIFLWIAIVLLIAKMAGLVEKLGQPAVLGELIVGIVLGNLALFGVNFFEPLKTNVIFTFLAELGVVILLFQIGLESNIREMSRVGLRAGIVAVIGVVVPFVLGTYVVGPMLLPGLASTTYLFLGAALTATSVGITARVFKDLGKLKTSAAQIVLGAAVIDDVLGLVILAVISAIATVGAVGAGLITWILAKAILFLVGSILLGRFLAPFLGKMFSKIHTGHGMKFTMALAFALVFAYVAKLIGLAPIVGAFAAGLVLDAVHFKFFKNPKFCEDIKKAAGGETKISKEMREAIEHHADRHVEELIEPVSYLFVPLFFVWVGMGVDLTTLGDTRVLLLALAITAVAFIGKIVTGFAVEKKDRWIVGFGMVPRGEVGLIFASVGASLGVISEEIFSIVVIMVIITTLCTPPILSALLKRQAA